MQSVPDIERVVQLSELFGVSLDYLLKDDVKDSEQIGYEKSENEIRSTFTALRHFPNAVSCFKGFFIHKCKRMRFTTVKNSRCFSYC